MIKKFAVLIFIFSFSSIVAMEELSQQTKTELREQMETIGTIFCSIGQMFQTQARNVNTFARDKNLQKNAQTFIQSLIEDPNFTESKQNTRLIKLQKAVQLIDPDTTEQEIQELSLIQGTLLEKKRRNKKLSLSNQSL